MSNEQILDPDAIEGLRSLGPDGDSGFLRELIEIYLADTPKHVVQLEAALISLDAAVVTRAAHTIKGSSSNFGAARLARVAQEIESYGKSANFAAATAACGSLKAEYALVAEALTKIAQGP